MAKGTQSPSSSSLSHLFSTSSSGTQINDSAVYSTTHRKDIDLNAFQEATKIVKDNEIAGKVEAGQSLDSVKLPPMRSHRSCPNISRNVRFDDFEITWFDLISRNQVLATVHDDGTWDLELLFLESQRRFEWWLLNFRQTNVSCRIEKGLWNTAQFYSTPEVEEMQYLYPVKLPRWTCLTSSHVYKNVSAVETGHPLMDDEQWRLLTYEQLLCVYHVLHTEMSDLEVHDMFHRDIERIDPKKFKNADHDDDIDSKDYNRGDADNLSSTMALETSFSLLRGLLLTAKTTFNISGLDNKVIGRMMVPNGIEGNTLGQYKEIHPCDLRYRVCRLLDCWVCATPIYRADPECITDRTVRMDEKELSEYKMVKAWIIRQLHLLYTSFLLKLHRLLKFYEYEGDGNIKYNINNLNWCYERYSGGFWKGEAVPDIPRFTSGYNNELDGLPNKLVDALQFIIHCVVGLGKAVDQDLWGFDLNVVN